jgi:hypothetical protein
MKRSLISSLSAILLLFLIASCGKEKSGEEDLGQYYLKCKIDGVDKTFNYSALASQQDLGGGKISYSVFGKAVALPDNLESLGFSIQLSVPFTKGTYKETDPTDDYTLGGIYNPNKGDGAEIYANRYDEGDPFQVTFTEITSTTLSGTFKGKLFMNSTDPNADSAIISNGSFKVKFPK